MVLSSLCFVWNQIQKLTLKGLRFRENHSLGCSENESRPADAET